MSTDLLVIAGLASEILEGHGFVACGRRENGIARVDYWTRDGGVAYRHVLPQGETVTVDEVVAACLSAAGHEKCTPQPRRISHLS